VPGRELGRQVDHPGAAQHDGLGAVIALGRLDRGVDALAGVRRAALQREDRDVGSADTGAPCREAVLDEILLDGRNGPRQRRDHVKRPATRPAAWKAASPIPTTGARASARAASNPVSSKQATTCPSTPRCSPRAISASRPGTASASS